MPSIAVCQKRNTREKEWITKEFKEIIEKKSNLYLKILNLKQRGESIPLSLKNNYNLVKKKAKNSYRKALNAWWEEKAKEADLQAKQNIKNGRGGSILKFLKITKQSKIKYVHEILDADNKTKLIESSSKIKRWKSYFETNANANSTLLPTAYDDFSLPKMSLEDDLKELLALPPTKPELESALKQCKSNTAAGIDDLNSDMLKLGAEAKVKWQKIISDQIWLKETVPADWRKQIIVPIYKKAANRNAQTTGEFH